MLDKIKNAILPAVNEMNLSIYDIEYVKEGNEFFLRIYLDREGGIDLEAIVEATKVISDILDEIDPIEGEYMLEISSPGAEKPLNTIEHLSNSINEYVRIELNNPKAGLDSVEGYLLAFDGKVLEVEYQIKTSKKRIQIDYDNVKKARLAIKF